MEELFSQELPVLTKLNSEERFVRIRISVFSKNAASSASPFSQELILRLTDDSDPFFLHTLALSEEEYSDLKSQQGLLIDFASFPQKLIELLTLCRAQHSKEQPKFVLQLIQAGEGRTVFEVVETNPFKHLTHLSLRVLPGTDRTVKEYLAECLRSYKTENGRLSEELAVSKDELTRHMSASRAAAAQQESELHRLQEEVRTRVSELSLHNEQELRAEREDSHKKQEHLLERVETEKRQLQLRLQKEGTDRGEEKRELENRLTDLREQVLRLETSLEQSKKEKETFSIRCQELQESLSQTRLQNMSSHTRAEDQSDELRRMTTKLTTLEQNSTEREQQLFRSSQTIEEFTADRTRLETAVQHKQLMVGKLEQAVKTASQEVNKGNEIIQKLQQELHNTKTRLRLKNTVTMEQEKAIAEREISMKRVSNELELVEKESSRLREESKTARHELEQSKKELFECQEQIKTNENVISWLNKQLNDRAITRTQPLASSMNHSLPVPSRIPLRVSGAISHSTNFNGNPSLPLPPPPPQYQLQYKKKICDLPSTTLEDFKPSLPFNPVTDPNLTPPPVRAASSKEARTNIVDISADPKYLLKTNPQFPFNPIAPLSLNRPTF
ncbi:Chain A, Serine/threonine-protein kinase PLK4 [Oopsacas minuta]|uniref:Chain A, Serine/threonine-protein kinase PLK4 n=1 Tax=Oopsacas minuta TaxID=111878 RepID=A0AAV7K3F5_9METZ|nr:Chain A, Serine/threonine-protein kinase PLK4 [Oopsacas minuta]